MTHFMAVAIGKWTENGPRAEVIRDKKNGI